MNGAPDGFADPLRDYPDYLRDESRKQGCADSISFPKTENEVRNHLAWCRGRGVSVTIQTARTGITGGAVPDGGHILNLSRMNRMLALRRDRGGGNRILTAQPGVLLAEISDALEKNVFPTGEWAPESSREAALLELQGRHFFPPDPTENSAAIGGMVASNASGARGFFYGATRNYVERLRVVLADGDTLDVARGGVRARGRQFELRTEGGRTIAGCLPSYDMPAVKNAAGYYVRDDMDLIDLFIGSEGTLGVVTEIDLKIVPEPRFVWGVMAFLAAEDPALRLVETVRGSGSRPAAIEFFDSRSLALLRAQKASNPAFRGLRDIPEAWHTAVYVEYHGDSEDAVADAVAGMSECIASVGGQEDWTWAACEGRELAELKNVRHAVPEAVNLLIDERRRMDPELTKLGTDLSVPDRFLRDVMAMYHRDLAGAGLEYVVFGHIGSNHVHVNIIPRDRGEYHRGKDLYLSWARTVAGMGGSVSAEHGIGKMKREMLRMMYGDRAMEEMKRLKALFDPEGRLNSGNLFAGGANAANGGGE